MTIHTTFASVTVKWYHEEDLRVYGVVIGNKGVACRAETKSG